MYSTCTCTYMHIYCTCTCTVHAINYHKMYVDVHTCISVPTQIKHRKILIFQEFKKLTLTIHVHVCTNTITCIPVLSQY